MRRACSLRGCACWLPVLPPLTPALPCPALPPPALPSFYPMWPAPSPRASDGVRLPSNPHIRAVEGGLVAVGLDGEDVVLLLDRALALDSSHQVKAGGGAGLGGGGGGGAVCCGATRLLGCPVEM